MSAIAVENGFSGTVFYDADCAFCRRLLDRYGSIFARRGFMFVPLQSAVRGGRFEIPAEEFLREMKLQRPDGSWLGGADAWIELFTRVWYLKPFGLLATLPGLHTLAHLIYRQVADNRHCLSGTCNLSTQQRR